MVCFVYFDKLCDQIFRKLNHHCLVQLYGICSGDDQPIYLVTEFMAKGNWHGAIVNHCGTKLHVFSQ